MRAGDRHFACTQCGACCDRSPEVELSEAAALADVFVFRLLLRLYPANGNERLRQFAAALVPGTQPAYLTMSALTVDPGLGRCGAMEELLCAIHERRPFSCRSVPLHYSVGEAKLHDAFDRFVAIPGYQCDCGPDAPRLLSGNRLIDPSILDARDAASEMARNDRVWKQTIFDRMKLGKIEGLPSVEDLRGHAATGALTTSMRIAWEIGVESGILDVATVSSLIASQVSTIDRMMAQTLSSESRQLLGEMRVEYALNLRDRLSLDDRHLPVD